MSSAIVLAAVAVYSVRARFQVFPGRFAVESNRNCCEPKNTDVRNALYLNCLHTQHEEVTLLCSIIAARVNIIRKYNFQSISNFKGIVAVLLSSYE